MRLVELNLLAFGPFTERRLEFAAEGEQPGLQIVYGRNEAGKSSALRGLKALLYGIDARSSDDFIHPRKKMRLAGRIIDSDGRQLEFLRRKGNKDTLLNPDGEAIGDLALAPYLRAVSADMFSSLFGIDHPALLRGGEEILQQQGELGRALFSAALGSHDLNAVIDGLNDEAEALFKPRGSRQHINAALSAYKECRRQLREHSLKPTQWQQQSKALQQTREQQTRIEQQLVEQRRELNRLQRIARLQPRFARRREYQAALARLQDVVLLGAEFSQRRQQAVTSRAGAQAVLAAARPRLEELRQQLGGLQPNQPLLAQADAIEQLHTRIGAEVKADRDRIKLVSEHQALREDAARLLATIRPDLGMDALEELRPALNKRRRIADLGNRQRLLAEKLQQLDERHAGLQTALKQLQQQSPQSRVGECSEQAMAALRQAIHNARREGDLDAALHSAERQMQALQRQTDDAISRAGLHEHSPATLLTLALPGRETITRFEQQFSQSDQQRQRLDDAHQRISNDLRGVEREIDQQQRTGSVPSEADLAQTRSGRDRLWQRLRRQWIDGGDISAEAQAGGADIDLPDQFEQRISSADNLADRLRREADRVQALASLQARRDELKRHIADLAGQREAAASRRSQLEADWQLQWRNVPQALISAGATPAEMRVWLEDFQRLREQMQQLTQQRADVGTISETRHRHSAALRQQMQALGQPAAAPAASDTALEPLLQHCEASLNALEQQHQQQQQRQRDRQRLQQERDELADARQQATRQHAEWQAQWRETLQASGLAADCSPAEAEEFFDRLAQLFDKHKDAIERQRRLIAIDRDGDEFQQRVTALVTQIAVNLADLPVNDAVHELNRQLRQSQAAQEARQQLDAQIQVAEAEITQAELTHDTATRLLDSLADEAGCEHSDAALLAAEQQSAEKTDISNALAELEQQILADGGGAALADLEQQSSGIDADDLPARITRLSEQIEQQLVPQHTELAEVAGGQQKELDQMDGSADAAELAEQAQALLADIRADVEHYVRVKLAGHILREQIERYRKENQGPLLQRASEHFAVLTLGSFERLTIDYNHKDQTVIAGLRPDGQSVQVQGMSAGTRDQLYLALRLASLEKYIHSTEPMPFIVDDVLVDFDDQRAAAALQTLAELAEKTQVILFTHHARLVEQAGQLAAAVRVHEL